MLLEELLDRVQSQAATLLPPRDLAIAGAALAYRNHAAQLERQLDAVGEQLARAPDSALRQSLQTPDLPVGPASVLSF